MFSSNHNRRESGGTSSQQNLSSFYTANYLEESMSYIERTAKKLLPILEQVKKKMIIEKKKKYTRDTSSDIQTSQVHKKKNNHRKNVETLEINGVEEEFYEDLDSLS